MKTSTNAGVASCLAAITLSFGLAPRPAHAQYDEELYVDEPWFLTVDAMVAGPLNDPARERFGVGGGGSFGLYRSIAPQVSFGLRLGAGALSGGGPVPQDMVDRGALDWGSLSATVRLRPFGGLQPDRRATGLWIEAGVGPWLVDGSADPVFDAGLGYGIELGPIVLAPMVRFTHVLETHGRFGNEDIMMGSGGIEVAWNDQVSAPVTEAPPVSEPTTTVTDAPTVSERTTTVTETRVPPALTPEEDVAVPFVNDQLVIDERVFFDYDSSDLRPTGAEQLDQVVRRYEESGDRWEALVVEGHADRRGPPDYNVDLSRKRAETVNRYLTARGVPGDLVELAAWGEESPAIPDASSEWEHQVNRRVEFRIVWREGERPEGVAPASRPTFPDEVDLAPEDRRDLP